PPPLPIALERLADSQSVLPAKVSLAIRLTATPHTFAATLTGTWTVLFASSTFTRPSCAAGAGAAAVANATTLPAEAAMSRSLPSRVSMNAPSFRGEDDPPMRLPCSFGNKQRQTAGEPRIGGDGTPCA